MEAGPRNKYVGGGSALGCRRVGSHIFHKTWNFFHGIPEFIIFDQFFGTSRSGDDACAHFGPVLARSCFRCCWQSCRRTPWRRCLLLSAWSLPSVRTPLPPPPSPRRPRNAPRQVIRPAPLPTLWCVSPVCARGPGRAIARCAPRLQPLRKTGFSRRTRCSALRCCRRPEKRFRPISNCACAPRMAGNSPSPWRTASCSSCRSCPIPRWMQTW